MNMNEEYLDNLLKSMNNASAAPEAPKGENTPFRAPEADLKPAKEENAGGSLTPEEIAALFDAAEKIANGEEPESLSDEPEDSSVSAPEETSVTLPEDTVPEETPVTLPEETVSEETPVTLLEETVPEETPMTLPEETVSEETPVTLPEETVSEETPISLPEETEPEDSPISVPETFGPDGGDAFGAGTGTSDNANNLADEASGKQPESAPEMFSLPEDMEKELQELQKMTEENEIPTEASYEEKPAAGETGPEGKMPTAGMPGSDEKTAAARQAEGKTGNSAAGKADAEAAGEGLPLMVENPDDMSEEPAGQGMGAPTGEGVMEMDLADIDELLQDKSEKKEKKPGFFKRLLALFTEEATPEEEPQKDENEEVLEELDKEDKTAEQDKKKKKEKKKKDKPAKGKGAKKNAKAGNEEDGNEEEDGKPEKGKGKDKGKAKKAPKKKKERPEVPEQEEKVSKGYTKKNIILVCLFSAAVFAVLYLSISYVAPGYAKKNAVTAFENQDYLTCYEILYGQKLTEREQQLFTFSNMVLRMQKKINDYDKYVEDGENLYALDSLMQAVEEYEETQEEALACGADGEMLKLYREVLTILQENYGLDEEGVRSIAFCDNKVEYTRMLDTLINGGTVDIKDEPATDTEDLPDLLPEEEETDDTEFLPEDTGNTL